MWVTGIKWLAMAIVLLVVLVFLLGQLGLLRGTPPADLGVQEGKLKRLSKTPNCVSSQADLWPDHPQQAYARIAPLALKGNVPATMVALHQLVKAYPGARVVKAEGHYLHAEFTTPWLKFTDDVEFLADPAAQVVHLRSASRLGRKDSGANRARVEALRAKLLATP